MLLRTAAATPQLDPDQLLEYKKKSIELITSRDPAFNHMGPLNQDPAWPNIVQGVRNLFSATKTQ